MITCTELPDVLRVQFTMFDKPTSQVDIVCFVRACDTGLEINYSHHISRSRRVTSGAWDEERSYRNDLTPSNVSAIQFNVWQELHNMFGTRVRPMPGEMDTPLTKVDF